MSATSRIDPRRHPALLAAEHLAWGKVVTSPDGPIAYWSPNGITSMSAGLCSYNVNILRPEALLGIEQVTPEMIRLDRRDNSERPPAGALFAKPLTLTSVDNGPPWQVFSLMRLRYRPEAGEGGYGRRYLQARCAVVDLNAWSRDGAFFVGTGLKFFRADPDVLKCSTDFNFAAQPLSLALEEVGDAAGALTDRIVDFLGSNRATAILELGDESAQSEEDFLTALASAMGKFKDAGLGIPPFGFSSNCSPRGDGRWIRYRAGHHLRVRGGADAGIAVSASLLEWQKLLIDAALSSRSEKAALLFHKTKSVWSELERLPNAEREAIKHTLPDRERALLMHFAIAVGCAQPACPTDEMRIFLPDAEALLNKFSVCSAWSRSP